MIGYVWILVLASCAMPGVDPFSADSPFELGPERVLSSASATQADFPDVAWNGEDFLVVWSARHISGTDLFAVRVSPNGDLVDLTPLTVSAVPGNQTRPSVAWGGAHFLVVWEDSRAGEVTKIFGTWVTARGEVLDPKGFALANSRYAQSAPLTVWTGSNFLVVWTEEVGGGSGNDLYATIVAPGISATTPQGVPIVTAPGDQFAPALAWGSSTGLLVWSDRDDLYAVQLDADGRRLNLADLLVSGATGGQLAPAVVWDQARFAIAWTDRREGSNLLYGAGVDGSGRLLDPAGVKLARGPSQTGPPTAVTSGGQLILLWTEIGSGQHLLVGRNGGRIGALAYAQSEQAPRLRAAATDRGELLIVWAGRGAGGDLGSQIFMRQAWLISSSSPAY